MQFVSHEKKEGMRPSGGVPSPDQNCNETASKRHPRLPHSLSHFTMYFHEIFRHARVKFREATGVAANFLAPPKTEAREAEKREGGWESASERGLR